MAEIPHACDPFVILADEVILAIGTFLPHPPDALSFTRVCRRLHLLTIPLLYENITLDYEFYSGSPCNTFDNRGIGIGQPQPAIKSLVASLQADARAKSPRLCPAIRSLKLRVPANIAHLCLGLWCLLENMTSLAELRFESLERDDTIYILPDCICFNPKGIKCEETPDVRYGTALAPDEVKIVLRPTNTTLKILTMFADKNGWEENGMSMGDLSALENLEYLDIQGKVFLGNDELREADPDFLTELGQRLPPKLKVLQLRCYSWDVALSNPDGARSMADQALEETRKTLQLLKCYLEQPERPQRSLEKVLIWLPEAQGKEWPEEMGKVAPVIDELTKIALSHGVKLITRTVDDTHWGISEYPGESSAESDSANFDDVESNDGDSVEEGPDEEDIKEKESERSSDDGNPDKENSDESGSDDGVSNTKASDSPKSYSTEHHDVKTQESGSSDENIENEGSKGTKSDGWHMGEDDSSDTESEHLVPRDRGSDDWESPDSKSEDSKSVNTASNDRVSSEGASDDAVANDGSSHHTESHDGEPDDLRPNDAKSDDGDSEALQNEPWRCQNCVRLGRTWREEGLSHIAD